MADLTAIRQAIADNLKSTLDGTQVSPYMLSDPTPPSAQVIPGDTSFDQAFGRGIDEIAILVQVFVSEGAGDQGAQRKLDTYLAGSGTQSVKAAIESDKTLGGACLDLQVTGVSGYRRFTFSEGRPALLGAEWRIVIKAAG